MKNITALLLAAGEGSRMKSSVSKVLHTILGKPILEYSLDLLKKLDIKPVVVLVHQHKEVKEFLPKDVKIVHQKSQKGTADAVKCAKAALGSSAGTVLIMYADMPLLTVNTIKDLIARHSKTNSHCTILTAMLEDPSGYGRISRDNFSNIIKIVEDRDANVQEKSIKEINTGIYCFDKKSLFSNIGLIKTNNIKKEYYLTDIIEIFRNKNLKIESFLLEDVQEAQGINSRYDLIGAQDIMRQRIINQFIGNGVTIFDPKNTYIYAGVQIGQDTRIYPFTVIEKDVVVGSNCSIGPFCRIRSNSIIEDNVELGNFIEVSRTKIGKNSFIKHFGYLGDSILGKGVNIGAGTVTANFDGKEKYVTRIQDSAFIGCDTVLIAPCKVGKRAVTGAGSVVLRNKQIPDNSIVVGIPARPLEKKKKIK